MENTFHKDPFENFVKDALEEISIEYNPAHWNELEDRLNKANSDSKKNDGKSNINLLKIIGIISLSSIATYLVMDKSTPEPTQISIPFTEVELIEKSDLKHSDPIVSTSIDSEINSNMIIQPVELNKQSNHSEKRSQETKINDGAVSKETKTPEPIEKAMITINKDENSLIEGQKTFKNIITPDFEINAATGCGKLMAGFIINADYSDYDFIWNFGDGNYSTEKMPEHLYSSEGTYSASLKLISKKDPEIQLESSKKMIKINSIPKADFKWSNLNSGSLNYAVTFVDKSENASHYTWNFGDGKISYDKNPKHNYLSKGTYSVNLSITNESGCSNSFSQLITIEEENKLLAPTAFSPNGDGNNDSFIPKGLEVMDVEFELLIYDKLNNLVYKTTEYTKPWNGSLNNSSTTYPSGSNFSWVVITKDNEGNVNKNGGIITIVK